MKRLTDFIERKIELKEMPNLYTGNPNVKIGNKYKIKDVEGSNFWLHDDDGRLCTFGSCRFVLN